MTDIDGKESDSSMSRLIPAIFGLSGFPALIYQVAWQRILTIHVGIGAFSVTMIVAAYMAGLGIGSGLGGRLSRSLTARGALIAFAVVELIIGAFAFFSTRFYYEPPGFLQTALGAAGPLSSAAFLLALLPPTIAMGMTFPLLVRALVRETPGASRIIGRLYGANLVGAAVGACAAPWLLIPWFGIEGATRFGACCNLAGALAVIAIGARRAPEGDSCPEEISVSGMTSASRRIGLRLAAALSCVSGFVAIALEILWFRIVDVGAKSTAFTFGTVLAIYLAGLAAGSFAAVRRVGRIEHPLAVFLLCQTGIAIYAAAAVLLFIELPPSLPGLDWLHRYWAAYEPIAVDGRDPGAIAALYVVFPLILFGPATFLMGFSYPVLQHGVAHEVRSSGFGVGLIQAANIAGCVLGALVVGLARLEDPGSSTTLRDLSIIGVGFSLAAVFATRRSSRIFAAAIAAAVVIASLTFCFPHRDRLWLRLHGREDGDTLVAEDLTGVAALIPEGGGRYRMSTNGKGQSLIPFGGIHSKLGALPATLHPRPERIAIIGLGSGDTAWAAACRAETTEILVFEVSSGQLPLLRRLSERSRFPALESFLEDRRVAVVTADGRTAIARDPDGFDLIEADAVRPNGAYSGNLYSVEFFRTCASRLRPKGLMCSWAPTPRTRRSFLHVFPHVVELDGGVVLIGSNDPIELDRDIWNARLREASTATYLGQEVLAECLGGLATARVASRDGRVEIDLNTDLDPRDEYLVPQR